MRALLAISLALTLEVVPRAAAADSGSARARALFEEGEALYRADDVRGALARFEAALALARRPSLLLNIAQCHRRLGHFEDAVRHYRRYLDEARRGGFGPVPFADEVRAHIESLTAAIARERERERRARERQAAVRRVYELPPPAPPPRRPLYRRWWVWTLVGAAVAGGVVAGVLASRRNEWVPAGKDGTYNGDFERLP